MSLINEALKKAQRQRTEEPAIAPPVAAPSPAGGAPAAPIAKRRPPMPARTLVILLVGGISVLFMAGVLAFLFLGDNSPVPPHAPAPVVAARPVVPVPPVLPPAPVIEPAPVAPVVEIKLPVITPAAPAVTPVPAPAPVAAHPDPLKSRPLVPVANPQVYVFL